MTTITPANLFILGEFEGAFGSPVSTNQTWNDRLAGTAFVGADPMEGTVIALTLDGPTVVGVTSINVDGTWEITGIAEPFATTELIILGVPRDVDTNIAIASRVKPVA